MPIAEFSDFCWNEILDSIHNGVVVVNRQGIIVVINKAAAELVNYSQAEALGTRVDVVIPNTKLLDIMDTGQAEYNCHLEIANRVVISNRSPIRKGNAIIGAVGIFQDVFDFEAISQQLDIVKEINKELDAIIESVDDGIVVANRNGFILRANHAYQQMTGITAEEFVGKHVRELVKQGYIGRSVTEMVVERNSHVTIVDIRNNKELLLSGNPVYNDKGELVRVVTAIRDVTQLNSLKEQLAETEEIKNRYYMELEHFRSQQPFRKIITNNPEMRQKLDLAFHVARVDSTVLILGESGVGKELIAQLIHRSSKRSKQPFIKINCGAIPANLLESEFFGYEPGAFTGALKEGKSGLFELAQGGTLFLDEIGEIPLDLQVKILRTLQDKEITRVGGKKSISLDVRIVAATNRDLKKMMDENTFREDLYYRLNVVPIVLPPLRNRKEDILPLINDFLAKYKLQYGYQKWIHPDVMERLLNYDWPGNIRELENTIERLVVTSREECILPENLAGIPAATADPGKQPKTSLKRTLESEEKQIITEVYRNVKSTRKAAAVLGISQSSLVKKLNKYGIHNKPLV
ncbi:MAG: sigma 54-interacting transcriptional regulator [Deltaproteobacteria bacterium]|nr:sigma 54-interacting transcriptional regulator [Deltaproteobacteria bacterium]